MGAGRELDGRRVHCGVHTVRLQELGRRRKLLTAYSQHFAKLKKEAGALGDAGTPTGSPAPKVTPRKSGDGKRKKAAAEMQDGDGAGSPTKKRGVKKESEDGDVA